MFGWGLPSSRGAGWGNLERGNMPLTLRQAKVQEGCVWFSSHFYTGKEEACQLGDFANLIQYLIGIEGVA